MHIWTLMDIGLDYYTTVGGRNPAPPGMYKTPLIMG